MAGNCPITSGRAEACNDSIGGIDKIYVIPYVENGFTITGSEVTAIDAGITEAFPFELRADANIVTIDGTSDENTGVSLFTETLTVSLKKLDFETSEQVTLLQKGCNYVVTRDRNGNHQLLGSLDGARVTASQTTTGGARTDFSGYNLTFTSFAKISAPFLDTATITALEAIESATIINP